MIAVTNLSKSFGSKTILKNISIEIAPGEIVGFLGPNAAGKTTLMRILTSFLSFEQGKVFLFGHDILKNSFQIRKKIGYLPETPPLYENMTVRQYLKFAARLKDIDPRQISRSIDKTLHDCDLLDVKDQVIGHLSKGYKQRVGIAQAIIHDPQLLILDEPTNGLDPLQIIQVRKLIKNLETNRTVIVSTHILSEIEQIAKRILIIRRGEIVADRKLGDLLTQEEKNFPTLDRKPTLEDVFLRLTA